MQQESIISKFGSGLVRALNDRHYRILFINNEFYVVEEYERPSDRNKFHYVRGRDITEMVISHGVTTPDQNTLNAVVQNVNSKPLVEREYSDHFSAVVYSPTIR